MSVFCNQSHTWNNPVKASKWYTRELRSLPNESENADGWTPGGHRGKRTQQLLRLRAHPHPRAPHRPHLSARTLPWIGDPLLLFSLPPSLHPPAVHQAQNLVRTIQPSWCLWSRNEGKGVIPLAFTEVSQLLQQQPAVTAKPSALGPTHPAQCSMRPWGDSGEHGGHVLILWDRVFHFQKLHPGWYVHGHRKHRFVGAQSGTMPPYRGLGWGQGGEWDKQGRREWEEAWLGGCSGRCKSSELSAVVRGKAMRGAHRLRGLASGPFSCYPFKGPGLGAEMRCQDFRQGDTGESLATL